MKKFILVLVIAVSCLLALTIKAEAVTVPMLGFDGFTHFSHSAFTADVYWQVFAPLQAPAVIGSNPYYTYVYQVYNIDGAASDNQLTQFGVLNEYAAPIIPGGFLNTYNIAPVPNPPTTTPNGGYYGAFGNCAYWTFDGAYAIPKGGTSYTLWFASPFVPGFVNGSVSAGGASQNASVPGPVVPEPASMLLLGLGALGMAVIRKRKAA